MVITNLLLLFRPETKTHTIHSSNFIHLTVFFIQRQYLFKKKDEVKYFLVCWFWIFVNKIQFLLPPPNVKLLLYLFLTWWWRSIFFSIFSRELLLENVLLHLKTILHSKRWFLLKWKRYWKWKCFYWFLLSFYFLSSTLFSWKNHFTAFFC